MKKGSSPNRVCVRTCILTRFLRDASTTELFLPLSGLTLPLSPSGLSSSSSRMCTYTHNLIYSVPPRSLLACYWCRALNVANFTKRWLSLFIFFFFSTVIIELYCTILRIYGSLQRGWAFEVKHSAKYDRVLGAFRFAASQRFLPFRCLFFLQMIT